MMARPDPQVRAVARLLIARRAMPPVVKPILPALIQAIVAEVAWAEGLRRTDILSRSREGQLVRARAAVVWIARRLDVGSTTKIGIALGRDHSTVLAAFDKACVLRALDPAFERLTNRIRDHFRDLQED
jgi:chromosomal replication initiation ATPase DnaA